MKSWHVYEDWTIEERPRCFYVGKGDDSRIAVIRRNQYHQDVVRLYGCDRKIVLTTFSESEALDFEKKLIVDRHTHPKDLQYNGIGCNRTLGGQGNSGRVVTRETCLKISLSKRGVPKSDLERQRISEGLQKPEVKKARSEARRGLKLSKEWKQNIAAGLNDPLVKEAMIEKVKFSIRAKYQDSEFRQRMKKMKARGEQSHSPFTNDEIIMMRKEWDHLDRSVRGSIKFFCERWASMKNVTGQAIYGIVTRKSWKHV